MKSTVQFLIVLIVAMLVAGVLLAHSTPPITAGSAIGPLFIFVGGVFLELIFFMLATKIAPNSRLANGEQIPLSHRSIIFGVGLVISIGYLKFTS